MTEMAWKVETDVHTLQHTAPTSGTHPSPAAEPPSSPELPETASTPTAVHEFESTRRGRPRIHVLLEQHQEVQYQIVTLQAAIVELLDRKPQADAAVPQPAATAQQQRSQWAAPPPCGGASEGARIFDPRHTRNRQMIRVE